MKTQSSQKPKIDNRSTIIKGFIKPDISAFRTNKNQSTFKPGPRFQSINRGRR
jgi:hypothetical protein